MHKISERITGTHIESEGLSVIWYHRVKTGESGSFDKNGKEQNFSGISIKLETILFHFKEILTDTNTNF